MFKKLILITLLTTSLKEQKRTKKYMLIYQ